MSAPDGQRRVALIIGNGAYSHASPLTNPANDARAMSALLSNLAFDVINGLDVARDPMEDLLFSFEKKVAKADVSLLFYAGHGLQVKGRNYLLPIDANIQGEAHLKRRAFSLNEILDIMGRNRRTSIVFLDACRNNPFARQLRELGIRDAGAKGLARVERVPGSLIAFATEADNVALDGRGDNSPFTNALLKHIPTSGLSLTDMMIDVRNDVMQETNRGQQPWVQYSLEQRFYFVPEKASPLQASEAPPQTWGVHAAQPDDHSLLALAAQEWGGLKDSTNIAELKRFVQHFSGTYYAELAQERIAVLEAEANAAPLKSASPATKRPAVTATGNVFTNPSVTVNQASLRKDQDRAGRIHIRAPIIHGAPKDDTGGWFKPGNGKTEWFKDIGVGPGMVIVPAGRFTMGSPEDEQGRNSDEGPQHEVTIANPFAVSRCAITFDEWDAYVADANGDTYKPDDQGWGRGRRPVINISWECTKDYIAWLSGNTGENYRLLSEAEWEYVARAGTTTPFWWGSEITSEQALFDVEHIYKSLNSGFTEPNSPVDKFAPNPWGLYNVHGNVWEWCEDIWHDTFNGAPVDGTAWLEDGDQLIRVGRGGSWNGKPQTLRSACRSEILFDYADERGGFRLARTLNG